MSGCFSVGCYPPATFKCLKYNKLLKCLIRAMIPFSFLLSISGVLLLLCSVVFLKYSMDRMGHSSDMVPTSAFKLPSLAAFSVLGFIVCVGIIHDLFIICHDSLKEWMKAYVPTHSQPSAIQIILLPRECCIILMQDLFRRCLMKYSVIVLPWLSRGFFRKWTMCSK